MRSLDRRIRNCRSYSKKIEKKGKELKEKKAAMKKHTENDNAAEGDDTENEFDLKTQETYDELELSAVNSEDDLKFEQYIEYCPDGDTCMSDDPLLI